MWEGKTSSFSFVVIWFILDIFSHTFDRFTNLTNIKLNQYSFEFLNKSHLFLFYHCQTLIVKLSLLGEGVRCFGSVWNPVLFLDEVIFREQGELFRLAIQFNHHPTSFGHLYPVLFKKKCLTPVNEKQKRSWVIHPPVGVKTAIEVLWYLILFAFLEADYSECVRMQTPQQFPVQLLPSAEQMIPNNWSPAACCPFHLFLGMP